MARTPKTLTVLCTACDTALQAEQLRDRVSHLLSSPALVEQFWNTVEMVDRNYITTNRTRIERELRNYPARSFRFLLNKN